VVMAVTGVAGKVRATLGGHDWGDAKPCRVGQDDMQAMRGGVQQGHRWYNASLCCVGILSLMYQLTTALVGSCRQVWGLHVGFCGVSVVRNHKLSGHAKGGTFRALTVLQCATVLCGHFGLDVLACHSICGQVQVRMGTVWAVL
jgi:hypothetical protein